MTAPISTIPLLSAAALIICVLASPVAGAAFPADELLKLTSTPWKQVTRGAVTARLQKLFEHLKIEKEKLARFNYAQSAEIAEAGEYVKINELTDTILIARKGVEIGYARNTVIISGGPVKISHASGALVIADAPIDVSHENDLIWGNKLPAGGMYVSFSRVKISFADSAVIYAVDGADISHAGSLTTYNTTIKPADFKISRLHRERIFANEPERAAPPPDQVTTPASMTFTGARCTFPAPVEQLVGILKLPTSAMRELNCQKVESTTVACILDTAAGIQNEERWTFEGCEQKVHFIVKYASSGNTATLNIGRAVHETDEKAVTLPENKQRITARMAAADGQKQLGALYIRTSTLRRDPVQARTVYLKMLEIDPNFQMAVKTIPSLDRQIADADKAAASYQTKISAGDTSARTLANRGLAYLSEGDAGRGLPDLKEAYKLSPDDSSIAVDLAWTYLLLGQVTSARSIADDMAAKYPKLGKVHEIRTWLQLISQPSNATDQSAITSLGNAGTWTATPFALEKTAYRLIAGYFVMRKESPQADARKWLGEWRPLLAKGNWPDAAVLYLLGELEEQEMIDVATMHNPMLSKRDIDEANMFAAMENHFSGNISKSNQFLQNIKDASAGVPTLAKLLSTRMYRFTRSKSTQSAAN